MRVGVEVWFKLYSPTIEGIDLIQRREKRAKRAKLYYMRYVYVLLAERGADEGTDSRSTMWGMSRILWRSICGSGRCCGEMGSGMVGGRGGRRRRGGSRLLWGEGVCKYKYGVSYGIYCGSISTRFYLRGGCLSAN
jgi:hypothetical protein